MGKQVLERFDVEWNTGAGWQCNNRHRFVTLDKAQACIKERRGDEKLRKWPMRLMRVDMATGVRTELPLPA